MKNFRIIRPAFRPSIRSQWLLALAALYFTTVLNPALWRYFVMHMETNGLHSLLFAISMPVFIFTAIFLFFNLLLGAYLIKPVLITLLLISSAASYSMFELGVFIDADMIRNVMETNMREATDLLNVRAILWILISGILPAGVLAITTIEYRPFWKETLFRIFAS